MRSGWTGYAMLTGVFSAGILCGSMLTSGTGERSALTAAPRQPAAGAEERLKQLKIELPPPSKSANTLAMAVRVGDLLYVSGHGPSRAGGKAIVGRLGHDMDVKQGREAARNVGLNILSTVRAELGNLDKVERVVKTLGMVSATPDFKDHPQVINGFSDLMVEVFGDKNGKGARSAVGMSSLPGGIPVEIEVILQIKK
jgi:enamine deaminase RidA (YjgF/YER057c/UK114 family)